MSWWRKSREEAQQLRVPAQYVLKLEELEARQDHLEGQLKTLRGYVYAKRGMVGPDPLPQAAPPLSAVPVASNEDHSAQTETRAQLRARLTREGRFIPGKPPVHSE